MIIGSSILTMVTLLIISPRRRKKVFERARTVRVKATKTRFKLPTFKFGKKKAAKKKVDIWKRK